MELGTIKHINFDTGVGGITPDSGGTDVAFILAVVTGTDAKSLAVGQAVEYEIVVGWKGPKVAMVRPAPPRA